MEASVSCNAYDDETRALERLLDIFGSALSLREIASAFCKAGRNFEMAADILSEANECSSSFSSSHTSNGKAKAVDLSEQLSENISKICEDAFFKPVKPKKHSAAVGTVSSVIGREYSKPKTPKTSSAGLSQVDKPLKVNLSEFAVAEIQKDDVLLDSMTQKDPINFDVEVFLFKMLGEGFQLGMDVIHDVLGTSPFLLPSFCCSVLLNNVFLDMIFLLLSSEMPDVSSPWVYISKVFFCYSSYFICHIYHSC